MRNFPSGTKKEIDQAVAEAARLAEQRLEHQMVLLKKEGEAEKRLAELQIQSLHDTVKRQAADIEVLHKQIEEAKQQVQDIAIKAIEGASGAKALSHVN